MAGFRDFVEFTKAKTVNFNRNSITAPDLDTTDSQSLWYDSDE